MTQSTLKHLAIIMDGNGRWAKSRGLPRGAGHKAGIDSVHRVMNACEEFKIQYLTIFAFSSENWRRPRNEVRMLMDLFISTLKKELNELIDKGVRLEFIGDISAFDQNLCDWISQAEDRTKSNTGLYLNIAVNYGGRWDIAQAAKKLAMEVQNGSITLNDINEQTFGRYLSLNEFPEPDLLIRTGGESRISNFLNWQLSYAELYFTNCLWPDFDRDELKNAVSWFESRQRRFGKTPEQIASDTKKIQHA